MLMVIIIASLVLSPLCILLKAEVNEVHALQHVVCTLVEECACLVA